MRGNLIASLLHNPDILFLDEPTLGLDIDSRHEFIEFIKSLKKNKITIFLTTHNMRDIEELCERIIIWTRDRLSMMVIFRAYMIIHLANMLLSLKLNV